MRLKIKNNESLKTGVSIVLQIAGFCLLPFVVTLGAVVASAGTGLLVGSLLEIEIGGSEE